MRARKYDKRIGIYSVSVVADGYGGNTVTQSYVGTSWGQIETVASSSGYSGRLTDLGITDIKEAIVVKIRHRIDITPDSNYFLTYNGYKYVIQSITNYNLKNVDLEIIAVKGEVLTT